MLVAVHFLTIGCRQILHTGPLKKMASLHSGLGQLSIFEYLLCLKPAFTSPPLVFNLFGQTRCVFIAIVHAEGQKDGQVKVGHGPYTSYNSE